MPAHHELPAPLILAAVASLSLAVRVLVARLRVWRNR
jgi:hypothetical protein